MDKSSAAYIEENNTMQKELERVKADLMRLRTDFSTLTEDTVKAARTGTAAARDALTEKAQAVADKGRESLESVEKQVVAHPFVAIGAALAIGAVLGMLISRTSSSKE